jgi:hypothetical protein
LGARYCDEVDVPQSFLRDQRLRDELAGVNAQIRVLGPRPEGDPDALNRVAHAARQEAQTAASLGRLQAAVPREMVFESPGARRVVANIEDVSQSFFAGQQMLEQAAHMIRHKANEIRDAQADWDRAHGGLLARARDLEHRLPPMNA